MKRMFTVGLDLDEVCAEYISGFRGYVAKIHKLNPTEMPDPPTWGFVTPEWGIKSYQNFLNLHQAAVKEGMFADMAPKPGAAPGTVTLHEAGVRIRIVTSRLCTTGDHARVVTDTVTWLDEHGFLYDELCFVDNKTTTGADVYVDDSPVNVNELRQAGKNVIVFRTKYNKFLHGPTVTTWNELVPMIVENANNAHATQ
jgi:5'-nucleotidase